MIAEFKKSTAHGAINAPTSKSMAHRLLISAALAEGTSVISGVTPSADVLATVDCLRVLGAKIENDGDTYTVRGCDMLASKPTDTLFCRESGSTLRFIIPVAALSGEDVRLSGAARLLERPLGIYEDLFAERGLILERNADSVKLRGPLPADTYTVKGNVSSQFISGLLFALPITDGDSIIKIIPPFESRSYIDLTISALRKFGIQIYFEDELTIRIPGNQRYVAGKFTVEGDYSGSAFLDALNLLGSDIHVLGLDPNSLQGDRAYLEFYPMIKEGTPKINIANCPDLAPILFTLAAYFNGAVFEGTARLKIKESDRAAVMAEELKKLGAAIEVLPDSVIIKKAELHPPYEVLHGHNDHRVVMSLSVLLSVFGGKINDAEAVEKSYPDFFGDIKKAGIEVTLYE
ncbi:MAG: 3-phosphoshikimate 1-carboxyvinyltransferase [Clostridia bacterium]|nr:3-phosphoshikimate 1-carboxyvinyltransferase [Clostridia bacterium]